MVCHIAEAMQVQLQSATAKLPQRHHVGIMEIPGIIGNIGISPRKDQSDQYDIRSLSEMLWIEAGFSLYAAQPATIPARGKAAEDIELDEEVSLILSDWC